MRKIIRSIILLAFSMQALSLGHISSLDSVHRDALRPLAFGNSQAQRKIADLSHAVRVMEEYANWRFWDYEKECRYYANLLNANGMRLLGVVRNALKQGLRNGVDNLPDGYIGYILDLIPSVRNPHPELFIDILPNLRDPASKQNFYWRAIQYNDSKEDVFQIQIGRGCYTQCTFCQLEPTSHMSHMPFPMFIKVLEEYARYSKKDILLYADNDPFHYRDAAIGANLADICQALKDKGIGFSLQTSGWAVGDAVAQQAAERIAQLDTVCQVSFNLYRRDMEEAIDLLQQAKSLKHKPAIQLAQKRVDTLYAKYKATYTNTILTLKLNDHQKKESISVKLGGRRQDRAIDRLTKKMLGELVKEFSLKKEAYFEEAVYWLPADEKGRRYPSLLNKELNRGYIVLRPYGRYAEIGYSGDKLIGLKQLADSGKLDRENIAFIINLSHYLSHILFKWQAKDFDSLPKSIQDYLIRKGITRYQLKSLLVDEAAYEFLGNNYGMLYPGFLNYMLAKREVMPADVDDLLERFPDLPVLNGLFCRLNWRPWKKVLIPRQWIRNLNQFFKTERRFYDAPESDGGQRRIIETETSVRRGAKCVVGGTGSGKAQKSIDASA